MSSFFQNAEQAPQDLPRWLLRLSNYQKALNQLTRFIQKGDLNELEEQGLVQAFEYVHELAWKTLKDFLHHQGETQIYGSKDATRLAFERGLIEQGDVWMDMIKSRNLTSHTYLEDVAKHVMHQIQQRYYPQFMALAQQMQRIKEQS